MSYNIVLTARKGIGWVGERGDEVGALAEERRRKSDADRVERDDLRTLDALRSPGASGRRLGPRNRKTARRRQAPQC